MLASADDTYPQPSTSFAEYPTSNIMTSVPVPVVCPSTSPHYTPAHSPALTASSPHSQASPTPPLTTIPSPIMQQLMQQSPNPNNNEPHGAEEEAIIEKFDSLDLDLTDLNVNLTQNLSASLFDSAPSITDTTYQDAPSNTGQHR